MSHVVAHSCNPTAGDMKAGRSELNYPYLHSEFEAETLFLKIQLRKKKVKSLKKRLLNHNHSCSHSHRMSVLSLNLFGRKAVFPTLCLIFLGGVRRTPILWFGTEH